MSESSQLPSKEITHYDIPTVLRGGHKQPCACVECRAADEIERLRQYEPLKGGTPLPEFLLRQERDRLRAALAGLKDLTCNECVPCKRINSEIDAALSGEHSAPETSERRMRLRITPRSREVYEALVKFQRIGEFADIELVPPPGESNP